jgi:thiamine biosynthesis protein ThiS
MEVGEISVKVRTVGRKGARMVRVPQGTRVADLLERLGQSREAVVVRLNGRIVAEEEVLSHGDSVEIQQVVTGG